MTKVAFTLAEVLITLGIIGVVAAMTIPGLMNKINDKVTSTKKEVMERKLVQGLNMLSNKESGLNVTYNNTEEFVQALSKYLKMSAICGKDDLNKCFPYDKIEYLDDEETKTINVSSITKDKMKLQGNWLEPAGFIMADGTPFIISYNNDCGTVTDNSVNVVIDPDRALKDIPLGCLDGIYDNNGASLPNKYGRDVQPLFTARFGKSCLFKIGATCIFSTAPVKPAPMSKSWCEANKTRYGISACRRDTDYWAGAMKLCIDQGLRLPKRSELNILARYLYNVDSVPFGYTYATLDKSKIPPALSGLGSSWLYLWSNTQEVDPETYLNYYTFRGNHVYWGSGYTGDWHNIKAICVDE